MFTPRYIKHGRLLVRHAEKLLRYRKDILSDTATADLKSQIETLQKSLHDRDDKAVKTESERLHALYGKHMPAPRHAAWRENVEVILVAVVVAVGIRSYFLQPFKIPTGSMQPTLNGIIGHPTNDPAPNLLRQVAEFFILGRNYINVVSAEDDRVEQVLLKKYGFFFSFSRVVCERQEFLVYAPPDTLRQDFKVVPGNRYKKGEVIARGAVDTGDQVFVDKFSYNFVKPHRGDVFVFRTDGIFGIPDDPETGAPFYIKRLSGLPGDELRIFVNGRKVHEAKAEDRPEVVIWGTGTPLREFMFADDFGAACVFLMDHYDEPEIINVGTGEEITILELARIIADVVSFKGTIAFDRTKPDGTPRKLMDSSRLHSLGFHHQTALREGIEITYQDFLDKVSVYAT